MPAINTLSNSPIGRLPTKVIALDDDASRHSAATTSCSIKSRNGHDRRPSYISLRFLYIMLTASRLIID